MAKRQTLNYNNNELVSNLKQSTGQGVDAFFSTPSPTQNSGPEVEVVSRPKYSQAVGQIGNQTSEPRHHLEVEPERRSEASVIHPVDRLADRTPVRKRRRVKVRYAFEFYQDQILKLKELRRAALLNDEDLSMSEVVRMALDQYFESTAEE